MNYNEQTPAEEIQKLVLSEWFDRAAQLLMTQEPVVTAQSRDGRDTTDVETYRTLLLDMTEAQIERQQIDIQISLFRAQTAYQLQRMSDIRQGIAETTDIGPTAGGYGYGGPVDYGLIETADRSVALEHMTLYDIVGTPIARKCIFSRVDNDEIIERHSLLSVTDKLAGIELQICFANAFAEADGEENAWNMDATPLTAEVTEQVESMLQALTQSQ